MHRDLKPENVMVVYRNNKFQIKLVDFGVCKQQKFTMTIVGTPGYIAPELVTAESNTSLSYDSRVDMWSVGAILYFMLHGYPPFMVTRNFMFEQLQAENALTLPISQKVPQ